MSSTREIDPFDDESQLRGLDRPRGQGTIQVERGAVSTLLQALGPHRKPVTIPVDDANSIAPPRKEDEEMSRERVMAENVARQSHQAVGSFAPVHRLRRHEEANARRETQHMPALARMSINRARVLVSNDVGIRST
jgi:hypothetical protein